MGKRGVSGCLRKPFPDSAFSTVDPDALRVDEVTIAVQVNGKVRSRLTLPADAEEDEVKKAALEDETVSQYVEGKEEVKVIVIPGRLVNVVVKSA